MIIKRYFSKINIFTIYFKLTSFICVYKYNILSIDVGTYKSCE